jgi:hypothetical protein
LLAGRTHSARRRPAAACEAEVKTAAEAEDKAETNGACGSWSGNLPGRIGIRMTLLQWRVGSGLAVRPPDGQLHEASKKLLVGNATLLLGPGFLVFPASLVPALHQIEKVITLSAKI